MQAKNAVRKSLCLLAGIVLLGISGAGVKASIAEEKAVNQVKNPGFEEFDKDGNPIAWFWYNNMGSTPTKQTYFEVDKKTYAVLPIGKGDNTGKMVIGDDFQYSGSSGFAQDGIEVEGDTTYLFTMKHIETENFPRNLYVLIRQYDAGKNDISGGDYAFATDVKPTTTWKTWSKQFKTKPKTTTIFMVVNPGGKGTAWFDDVSLVKIVGDKAKE